MEFLVCCVFAYWLVKHTPQLVGEAVTEWRYATRGEESPAAAARRARLEEAGVDPAAGGAFRQFAGNVWRDFWLDLDGARQDRRDGQSPGQGAFARLRERLDGLVEDRVNRWRSRGAEDTAPFVSVIHPDEPKPDAAGQHGDQQAEPQFGEPEPEDVIHEPQPAPADQAPPSPEPPTSRDPIRVQATLGDPPHTSPVPRQINASTAVLEGEPMSNAVANGTAVTGVVSGAAEARAIQRNLEAATAAYEAAVANARRRIHSMGEQTVGVIQMAGRSTVVNACAQAAEAIAAAQASVNGCRAEVIPLLGRVAREFDKRNS